MKIRITLIIITAFLICSCSDDFLERESKSQLSEENVWNSASDAQMGINGVYAVLKSRTLYGGNFSGSSGLPTYDNFTDNSFNQYKYHGAGHYVEGNVDPSTSLFDSFWTNNYKGIARANTALKEIGEMSAELISDEIKKELEGQAYFLRALFNFNLAVYYIDAPLVTDILTLETSNVAKNTQAELFAQVETDLLMAVEYLSTPQMLDNALFGYATKGSAYALLARTALFQNKYEAAAGYAKQVIDLDFYGLYSDYETLFSELSDAEQSNEIVFSVRFLSGESSLSTESFSSTFTGKPRVMEQPMKNVVEDYYCTDGLPIKGNSLYNKKKPKENRDPRLISSVYFKGDLFLVSPKRVNFKGNTKTKYGKKKYTKKNSDIKNNQGGQDFYVIRYADVLLMRAEALIESGETGQEIYDLINLVRKRVSMPKIEDVEGTGLSKDQLREIVRHERRVELAFEGLRFYDLKRWGTMEEAYQRMIGDNVDGYNPLYRGGKSEAFPIPQTELDVNKNLTQNDIWK